MTTGLLFDLINPAPTKRRWVPDTSKAAHTALVNAGKVNGRKADVLEWLMALSGRGGMTAAELSDAYYDDTSLEHVLHIRRGLSDLRKSGLVCKGTDRLCRITSTKVIVWKVVSR